MLRGQWPNVVALPIIVPCDYLDETWAQGQDLDPSVIPKQISGKHPVLAVWNLRTEMGTEPRRNRSDVRFASECFDVCLISFLDCDITIRRRCLVSTVVWPSHPIQCTIDSGKIGPLLRMKVGSPEDWCSCSGADGVHIDPISSEARGEDLAVDVELRLGIGSGILGDLLTNLRSLVCVVPVEVKRDKDLHVVVGSRLVGEAQLLVSVRVYTDVEGKRVDPEIFGPLHVGIVVCWSSTIGYYADHKVAENEPVRRLTLRNAMARPSKSRRHDGEQKDCEKTDKRLHLGFVPSQNRQVVKSRSESKSVHNGLPMDALSTVKLILYINFTWAFVCLIHSPLDSPPAGFTTCSWVASPTFQTQDHHMNSALHVSSLDRTRSCL